jgi:mevalonate pyrophosphate decarboxylase
MGQSPVSSKSMDSRNGNKNKPDNSFYYDDWHEKTDKTRIKKLKRPGRRSKLMKRIE